MPESKVLPIIIDTNLWISFLISGRQDKLDRLIYDNRVRILFSIELLNEITITTTKPKLQKYFGPHAIDEMLVSFNDHIDFIDVKKFGTTKIVTITAFLNEMS